MHAAASPPADPRVRVSLPELLALRGQAAHLRLPPQQSRSAPAGIHASRLYGRGMDYAESRAYQPGDDVRRLDWRLTARSGKLHTKLFQEEREGRLLIMLDTHASMRFGTRARFKSVQAARAAALAAWYAVRAGERVGALAFGACRQLLRPQAGSRGALALCGALANWDAAGGEGVESLGDALGRAAHLPHGAGRVLLISDGSHAEETLAARLRELHRRSRIGVLVIADPLELRPPPAGRYPLEHDGVRREVDLLGAKQRMLFQQRLGAGVRRLEQTAVALGLPCRTLDTATDPGPVIADLLGRRTAR